MGRWRATAHRGLATGGLLAALLVACAPAEPLRERWAVFGSSAELRLPAGTPEPLRADAARGIAMHWQARERLWHAWEPSALTAFNTVLATQGEAVLPTDLRPLVERSRPLVAASGGVFDPGIGRLVALWGFHTSDYPIRSPAPDEAVLSAWASRPDSLDDLHCDAAWRCTSHAPALQLDFNAMAEGLALEEAAVMLRGMGIEHALMNLGGDVLALGRNGDAAWRVGLDDGEGGVLGGVELHDGEGLMSSGRYAKYREAAAGERWAHVLDPRTGQPVHGVRLSAVLHADPVRADAASTALLAAGPAGFEGLARDLGLGCALLVDEAGQVWITAGMAARFQWERRLPEARRVDTGGTCDAR